MLNLNAIKPEELAQRIDNIPKGLKDFLASPVFAQKLNEIGEKYVLIPEVDQPDLLEQVIALLAAGLIKPEELAENLKEFVYLDHETAKAISEEVLAMMKPVLPIQGSPSGTPEKTPLVPKFTPAFTGKPTNNESTTNIRIEQNKIASAEPRHDNTPSNIPSVPKFIPSKITVSTPSQMKPDFTPTGNKIASPETRNDTSPAPFMIHESSGAAPQPQNNFGISRPTFIRPQFTPAKSPASPVTATVQFGEQVIGKPSATNPKIVNYSATKPMAGLPKNDDNTINLRDLPK